MITPTPPEKCPICGSKKVSELLHTPRLLGYGYSCGIDWLIDGAKWGGNCEYATAAALRCRATLLPTELEQARNSLVTAAIDAYQIERGWADSMTGVSTKSLTIALDRLQEKSATYIAALDLTAALQMWSSE